jgi:hypothetical protein
MGKLSHQDHFVQAEAEFGRAIDSSEPADRADLLSIAVYHAAMASYLLALEVDERQASVSVKK